MCEVRSRKLDAVTRVQEIGGGWRNEGRKLEENGVKEMNYRNLDGGKEMEKLCCKIVGELAGGVQQVGYKKEGCGTWSARN